ncbi:HNH endonuclease [Pseudomonas sp. 2hn]|uniref:HNH endonuclease n=1 Tax=Pseudomonas sp. 2hn TaxID=2866626 RepID=UPI001C7CC8BE|nr:HNH endonuclease [Pseudomonas sp. 2hn]QZA52599.1 HNH endonuclease [Pseudomonas sp. 2hn]
MTRPDVAPDCTKQSGYNTEEIVNILEDIFYGKCYLCEQFPLPDPEIEHFHPHSLDEAKKYEWTNLYYACSRCNSIKGTKHTNLLDCCNPEINIDDLIELSITPYYDEDILVAPLKNSPSDQTLNTIDLLRRCYNDAGTPLRRISRKALMENISDYHLDLLLLRKTLKNRSSGERDIIAAADKLKAMISPKHPFSALWKTCIKRDSVLSKIAKDYNFL